MGDNELDQSLVLRVQKGDKRAFDLLVSRYQHRIISVITRYVHDWADAQDVAQDTFIRAYRALQGYDPQRIRELRLRGWIWTIALNLGRNHARDRARRPLPVELDDRHGRPDPELADSVAWDRRLDALPAAQRRAVVLRHVVGLSYSEIAEAVARPEGTVKTDVHRGLERLRAMLEQEERT
jgi:RNA polymerase sigma-70 factor (ECF subfamily)